jgi:5S rRNA maturation endonuclease (ribonuclease M5)
MVWTRAELNEEPMEQPLSPAEILQYYKTQVPNLHKANKELRGICVLHKGTRKDSLAINSETGQWCCHSRGCGKPGGSIYEFESLLMGVDIKTAFKNVLRIAGRAQLERSRITKAYNYVDESGKLLFQCVRLEPKGFFQRKPAANGGWIKNLEGVRRVLYRLPDVIAARVIYIAEGEKDCETLAELGLVGTCNPAGAGAWRQEYAECLRDKKIFVLPDADEKGRKHAADVMRSLKGVAASVAMVELPFGKDITEWVEQHGGTRAELDMLALCADPDAMPDLETDNANEPRHGETHRAAEMPEAGTLVMRRASEVEARPIRWLWKYRIPCGKLTIIAGHPDLGKSQVTCYFAARVTRGGPWPDGAGHAVGGGQVVILSAEDDSADTLVPRLEAAGADLERVHIVDGVIRGYSGDGTLHQRMFSLETDLAALDAKLTELQRVELVVIDPLSAYLGNIDSHVNAEVRGALGPVKQLPRAIARRSWPSAT